MIEESNIGKVTTHQNERCTRKKICKLYLHEKVLNFYKCEDIKHIYIM